MLLIVEGCEPVRRLLARTFRDAGFQVVTASTLREANQLFFTEAIDFLLTCWLAPDGSAEYMVKAFLARKPELKFLIISGTDPVLPEGWPFLAKPFRPAKIIERVLEIKLDYRLS